MFLSPDSEATARAGSLRNILVVDDEPTLRLGFAYALTSPSTHVEAVATGRLALEKIEKSHFDIVILDLRMPDIDGLGVIEHLRAAGNPIPIVLCSAALTPAAALRAIRHNVVDFLLKPVHPADLREVIQFVLSPPPQPVALALQAARAGRLDDAIRHLERDGSRSDRSTAWHDFFQSLLTDRGEDDASFAEKELRFTLSNLAFRSSRPL